MFVYIGKYKNHKSVEGDIRQTLVNIFFNSWWTKLSRFKIIRVHKHDTYTAVHPIAEVAYHVVKKYNDISLEFGFKYSDRDDAPKSHDYDDEHVRWKWIMREIEFCLNHLRNDNWEDQFHVDDYDAEGCREFNRRLNNGMRLFGKYFQGMWW